MENGKNKKVIAAGLLVMSLTMACNSALAPILAEVGKFFPDAGDSAIQIVLTLINLTTLPAMILEPMLEPKITKRDIAVIGTALMLIGGLMPQVLNSQLWMLYAASVVIGVGLSFVVVTSSSLIILPVLINQELWDSSRSSSVSEERSLQKVPDF